MGAQNAKYRQYRVQLAKRAIARGNGEIHAAKGYKECRDTRRRPGLYNPDIVGSYVCFKIPHTRWQRARVTEVAEDAPSKKFPHTVKMLDLVQRPPSQEKLTTVRY